MAPSAIVTGIRPFSSLASSLAPWSIRYRAMEFAPR